MSHVSRGFPWKEKSWLFFIRVTLIEKFCKKWICWLFQIGVTLVADFYRSKDVDYSQWSHVRREF